MSISGERDHDKLRMLMLSWSRRGAMPRFMLDLAATAMAEPGVDALVSVSTSNELFEQFAPFQRLLVPVDTFRNNLGAFTQAWRIPSLRRQIARAMMAHRTQAVVTMMPHVWTPLVAPVVKRMGASYAVIVHDARGHPDDPTGLVHDWLLRDIAYADTVICLSQAVADQLIEDRKVEPRKLRVLFHPDMASAHGPRARGDGPLRALFFGRIMGYKGLPLFVEAIERLRMRGVAVEASVYGEGALGNAAEGLKRIGATVENRWINEAEIPSIFQRHDVVVLSHVDASQSGVAAVAFGQGVPVVVTPAGGLHEQVLHGRTGLIAARVDADAIADELMRLATEPDLLRVLNTGVDETRQSRSVARFLRELMLAVKPSDAESSRPH